MQKWILLALLSVAWGVAFMFQDMAVSDAEPLTATAIRLVVAASIAWAAMRIAGERLPHDGRRLALIFLLGLAGNTMPFTLITWGQETVKSSVAGILVAIVPLVTLVLAHFFVKGEHLTRRRGAGFALGFAGVVVLLGPEAMADFSYGAEGVAGYFYVLAGAICFGIAPVLAAHLPETRPLTAAAGVLIAAAATCVPAAFLFESPVQWPGSGESWWGIAALAVAITPLATWAYFRLVARAGPAFLSLFNYFNPLVAVVCGVLFLDESIRWTAFAALGLIFLGVTLSEWRKVVQTAETLSEEVAPAAHG